MLLTALNINMPVSKSAKLLHACSTYAIHAMHMYCKLTCPRIKVTVDLVEHISQDSLMSSF